MGKFSKFGKFTKSYKEFGFIFKGSQCHKNLEEYKKHYNEYQHTQKESEYAKAEVLYNKFCDCGKIAKKDWMAYQSKCGAYYNFFSNYYKDFESSQKRSAHDLAQGQFDKFCKCSEEYFGKPKWEIYQKQIQWGCKELFSQGKCIY